MSDGGVSRIAASAGHIRGRTTMPTTRSGFLVLADITGFTAFVTTTEIEHGPPMVAELLEEVIHQLAPPLDVHAIEGDAVFALGPDGAVTPPARLLDVMHAAFVAFREKQRALEADDSCDCDACRSVGRLRLKMIGHYGAFLEHTIGGRVQIGGADAILAHRMLKNRVRRRENYALITRSALQYMDVDPLRLGMLPHTERYEHFGDVECYVEELAYAS